MASLLSVFSDALVLSDYIMKVSGSSPGSSRVETGTLDELLYVLPPVSIPFIPFPDVESSRASMIEIINNVIAQSVRLSATQKRQSTSLSCNSINPVNQLIPRREVNCLAHGYRFKSVIGTSELRSYGDIECHFVNSLHSYLTTQDGQALARKYGEAILQHVFSQPTFLKAPNGCFIQLSGTPVADIIRVKDSPVESTHDNDMCILSKIGIVQIPRFQIFYKDSLNFKFTATVRRYLRQCQQLDKQSLIVARIFDISRAKSIHSASVELGISGRKSMEIGSRDFEAADAKILISIAQIFCQTFLDLNCNNLLQTHCPLPQQYFSLVKEKGQCESHVEDNLESTSSNINSDGSEYPPDSNESSLSCDPINKSEPIPHVQLLKKKTKRGVRAGRRKTMKDKQAASKLHRETIPLPSTFSNSLKQSIPKKSMDSCKKSVPLGEKLFQVYQENALLDQFGSNRCCVSQGSTIKSSPSCTLSDEKETMNDFGERNILYCPRYVHSEKLCGSMDSTLLPPYSFEPAFSLRDVSSSMVNTGDNGDSLLGTISVSSNNCVESIPQSSESSTVREKSDELLPLTCDSQLFLPPIQVRNLEVDNHSSDKSFFLHEDFNLHVNGKRPHVNSNGTYFHLKRLLLSPESISTSRLRTSCKTDSDTLASFMIPFKKSKQTNEISKREKIQKQGSVHLDIDDGLFSLMTSQIQVSEFIKSICRRCFPMVSIWGSRHNLNCFLRSVDLYIRLGRGETLNLSQIMIGVRIKDFPWLKSLKNLSSNDRRDIAFAFVYWIFSEVINSLIGCYFYVTDGEGRGSEVLYYRRECWSYIVDKGITQMKNYFVEVTPSSDEHNKGSSSIAGGLIQRAQSHTVNQAPASSTTACASSTATVREPIAKWYTFPISRPLAVGEVSMSSFARDYLQMKANDGQAMKAFSREEVINPPSTTNNVLKESNVNNGFYPTVRFLPKKSSVRAITNMKSTRQKRSVVGSRTNCTTNTTSSSTNSQYSTPSEAGIVSNSSLYNCLHILRQLYTLHPYLAGFGVFGMDDIYLKLRHFMKRHGRMNESAKTGSNHRPSYYVAVLDLEKCYDNVNTNLLYDVVQNIIFNYSLREHSQASDDVNKNASTNAFAVPTSDQLATEYMIHRYTVSHNIASMERVVTKTVRHVSQSQAPGDFSSSILPIHEAVDEISRNYKNSLITDGVVYSRIKMKEVLRILRIHLFSHIVNIPNSQMDQKSSANAKVFCQVKGIPQGSVLSPILCHFYYGSAEMEIFGSDNQVQNLGIASRESLIMRLMDDYIMISTNRSCVEHFLQKAHTSLKYYGGGVNPLKTKVNFDVDIEFEGKRIKLPQISTRDMPWCGFFLDTEYLEFRPNYGRLLEHPIPSSFAIPGNQPGLALRRMMKSFVRMKCHALVLDGNIIRLEVVMSTVYNIFLVSAMRSLSLAVKLGLIQRLPGGGISGHNNNFLIHCIDDAIIFGSRLLHSRTKHKLFRSLQLSTSDNNHNQHPRGIDESNSTTMRSNLYTCHGKTITQFQMNNLTPDEEMSQSFGVCEINHIEGLWLGYSAFHRAIKFVCTNSIKDRYHGSRVRLREVLRFLEEKITSTERMIPAGKLSQLTRAAEDRSTVLDVACIS